MVSGGGLGLGVLGLVWLSLWARREEVAAGIRSERRNPDYLPGARLPDTITATADVGEALDGADLVAMAVPSHTLRENLTYWVATGAIAGEATLVSLIKGIELGTGRRMTEVIAEVAGADPGRVAVITGPNLAGEIAFQGVHLVHQARHLEKAVQPEPTERYDQRGQGAEDQGAVSHRPARA